MDYSSFQIQTSNDNHLVVLYFLIITQSIQLEHTYFLVQREQSILIKLSKVSWLETFS